MRKLNISTDKPQGTRNTDKVCHTLTEPNVADTVKIIAFVYHEPEDGCAICERDAEIARLTREVEIGQAANRLAARAVETLTRERDEARAALDPFADLAMLIRSELHNVARLRLCTEIEGVSVDVGVFRAAARALGRIDK